MDANWHEQRLEVPERSFFLFGPRSVGKSTCLRDVFREAAYFDLLEAMVGRRPPGAWVVLDEIQKLPQIPDEVHRLMEVGATDAIPGE